MAQAISRSRTRIAAVLLLCLWLLLSIATDHALAGQPAKRRAEMLQLTNEARDDKSRDALKLDSRLSRYAVKHSREMANKGYLFHTEDLAARLKGDWSMGGENVGVGSSLTDLQAAFMGSKPHRRNVLRAGYDHTAIGVVQSDGSLWVTVIFYG
ncbi:MAG: CAP domain-containing protein [Actinomycetota bacterium]